MGKRSAYGSVAVVSTVTKSRPGEFVLRLAAEKSQQYRGAEKPQPKPVGEYVVKASKKAESKKTPA